MTLGNMREGPRRENQGQCAYGVLLFRRAVCFGFNANRQSANSRRRRQAVYGGGLSMASHPVPWRVYGIGEVLAFARSMGFFNVNAARPHRA